MSDQRSPGSSHPRGTHGDGSAHPSVAPARADSHWDPLRRALQVQRSRVGNPSYAEIAARIAHHRQAAGVPEHAARVARSTVYDAFRLGRARINLSFAREIARSLGTDDLTIDTWVATCHQPSAASRPHDGAAVAADQRAVEPVWLPVLIMMACVAANLLGRVVVDVLHLPIYLDMVGTAIAAVGLGPWRGAAVGFSTNALGAVTSGWVSFPFALVNVAGALVWGYGVHRFGWGRSLPRFLALTIVVAVTCSLVAVPILVMVFGGSVGQGQDTITRTFSDLVHSLTVAVGFANLLTSVIDKLLSGFIAIAVVSALPLRAPRSRPSLPALTIA